MTSTKSLGRHLLVEYTGCDPGVLNDVSAIEGAMVSAAQSAGARINNTSFHHFSPHGVSGVVVIHESHLAIHTWPEYGFAAADLFTCGADVDPWEAHRSLGAALKASASTTQEIPRGQLDLLPDRIEPDRQAAPRAVPTSSQSLPYSRNIWFTNRDDDIALSIRHSGSLFRKESTHQKVEVLDTVGYGKMLVLDDTVMCTERDEFVYHEMIVHVPALVHPDPKRALVIGGGDGGAARELLKHKNIEEIVIVEIDETVVEAARAHFPDMASSLDDSKVDLQIQDGVPFLQAAPDGSFDLVIVDSTDPKEIAAGLFQGSFYEDVRRSLKTGGIMAAQSEPPALHTRTFRNIYDRQRKVFGPDKVFCYLAFIPTYTTGMISFSFASADGLHPLEDLQPERVSSFLREHPLRYYNPEVHRASFALPGFVQELLDSPAS